MMIFIGESLYSYLLICNSIFLFFPCSSIVFVCFSKASPKGQYVNLACKLNISSPVRYSCLLIFPGDNADIFAAFP